jgi:hypothetical protein
MFNINRLNLKRLNGEKVTASDCELYSKLKLETDLV